MFDSLFGPPICVLVCTAFLAFSKLILDLSERVWSNEIILHTM